MWRSKHITLNGQVLPYMTNEQQQELQQLSIKHADALKDYSNSVKYMFLKAYDAACSGSAAEEPPRQQVDQHNNINEEKKAMEEVDPYAKDRRNFTDKIDQIYIEKLPRTKPQLMQQLMKNQWVRVVRSATLQLVISDPDPLCQPNKFVRDNNDTDQGKLKFSELLDLMPLPLSDVNARLQARGCPLTMTMVDKRYIDHCQNLYNFILASLGDDWHRELDMLLRCGCERGNGRMLYLMVLEHIIREADVLRPVEDLFRAYSSETPIEYGLRMVINFNTIQYSLLDRYGWSDMSAPFEAICKLIFARTVDMPVINLMLPDEVLAMPLSQLVSRAKKEFLLKMQIAQIFSDHPTAAASEQMTLHDSSLSDEDVCSSSGGRSNRSSSSKYACWKCGEQGHFKANCPSSLPCAPLRGDQKRKRLSSSDDVSSDDNGEDIDMRRPSKRGSNANTRVRQHHRRR